MARELVEIVELPLTEGIVSSYDGYVIGPRPRILQNLLYRSARLAGSDLRRRTFSASPVINSTPVSTAAGATRLFGMGHIGSVRLAFGATSGNVLHAYDAASGTQLTGGTAKVMNASTDIYQAAFAHWSNIATPTSYFSHGGLGTGGLIYQTTNGITRTDYTGTNIPNGASALIVHLDRLWMAKPLSNRRTLVWFTDVLNPATVRAASFLDIPDEVRCLFRASPSQVDIGLQAHLILGCLNQIWVFDGDPTLGNGLLRRLALGIGIQSQSLIAETQQGAVVLATDGQCYLIPPGATELVPIGESVRDQFVGYKDVTPSAGQRADTLLWLTPYVLYWPGTANNQLILDLSQIGSQQAPTWSGPHTPTLASAPPTLLGALDYPADDSVAEETLIAGGDGKVYRLTTALNGRTQKLVTGYIWKLDHDIQLRRVHLFSTRRLSGASITVSAGLLDGTTVTLPAMTPATTSSQAHDKVARTSFAPTAQVRGDFFTLTIEAPSATELELRRAVAEIYVHPRQH